ncbi:hypothetical protein WJX81_007947 [Elliptochloris bilobata]|uniref:Uncharacterized protein n=1 Tax=Elliptochloris bilobata TaxID=381761 RepID=A0AAW1SKM2_9CHLO
MSELSNGLVAKGVMEGHDFLGPMLLPLAVHLPASFLQSRYVETGNSIVVVHTLPNPGGELGAQLKPLSAPGPATMPGMDMGAGAMGGMGGMAPAAMTGVAIAPAAMSNMAPAPSPAMPGMMMGGMPMGGMPAGGG